MIINNTQVPTQVGYQGVGLFEGIGKGCSVHHALGTEVGELSPLQEPVRQTLQIYMHMQGSCAQINLFVYKLSEVSKCKGSAHRRRYRDEPEKWKTRILGIADPVCMGRKSPQYTILQCSVPARLSAFTDWISSTYVLAQYPRLPFCVLIYLNLLLVIIFLMVRGK